MKQILHNVLKEYQELKNKKEIIDIEPSINGEKSSAFNIFWASLFASNRNLSGKYLTIDFIKDREMILSREAPKIFFLDYDFSNTLIFIQEDVKKMLPQFSPDDRDEVKKLKNLFENNKINSFATGIKSIIENDFGAVYEVDFEKTILNYKKIEAVPIEYVQDIEKGYKIELTTEEKELKNKVEKVTYENFEEALQHFYFLINAVGKVSISMLNKFELFEIGTGAELVVKCNNNFILSQELYRENITKHSKYEKAHF